MPHPEPIPLTALLLGGGIAGLWTLDTLRRAGHSAILLEPAALGTGQSIASQGIIHGGVKYTLSGIINPAAEAIREMPALWRACLAGQQQPDLSAAKLRADHCHLWHTRSLSSRLSMLGARVGLRVAPVTLEPNDRPDPLKTCLGTVARLDEQVIDTSSVLAALAERNRGRILHTLGAAFTFEKTADAINVTLTPQSPPQQIISFRARHLILTAGTGNAHLREQLALDPLAAQTRPLHQVLVRGELPTLNGHCTDGAATRATITTASDSKARTVWQVGGQIAEKGVAMSPEDLIGFAKSELAAVLPAVSLANAEWSTHRAVRAEMKSPAGTRPDDATILQEGPVITAWPTKLALAPRLAELVLARVTARPAASHPDIPTDWPPPPVASEPWNQPLHWRS